MAAVFLKLLNLSISASWLVLAVLVLTYYPAFHNLLSYSLTEFYPY